MAASPASAGADACRSLKCLMHVTESSSACTAFSKKSWVKFCSCARMWGRIGSKFAPLEAAKAQTAQGSLAALGVTLRIEDQPADSCISSSDEEYDEPLPEPLLQVIFYLLAKAGPEECGNLLQLRTHRSCHVFYSCMPCHAHQFDQTMPWISMVRHCQHVFTSIQSD